MRAYFSYGLALLILLGAGAWLATGTLVTGGNGPGNGERPIIGLIEGEEHGPIASVLDDAGVLAHHDTSDGVDPTLTIAQRIAQADTESGGGRSVRTVLYTAEPMPIEVPLRGRTQAKARVNAVAETAGTVRTVHVSKGESVEIGDPLCTLDQGTRAAAVAQAQAQLAQAEASLVQAQLDFDTNADLRDRGLAAANTTRPLEVALSSARAQVSAAEAGLENAEAELDRTEIVAEVAGLVQDPVATQGSFVAQGGACATIVQLNPILFEGMVPEAHIGLARVGLPADVSTVTGQAVEGEVSYISATADDATRSFMVEIEIPNEDFAIRDGVTAEAVVNLGTAPGHLLPQSVLTLDDEGTLGVRTVEDGIVAFHPITIVRDTRDGVWVTGLPAQAEVITVGQEFVTAGQAVSATRVEAEADPSESVQS
jgi:multidrug efflux system membrane fusion protein